MASPNNLVVRLTAVDLTSQAIDSVARKLAGITAPATKVTKSLARLSDATGVTRMSRAIAQLGGTAVRAGDHLVGALAPLGALTAALSVGGFGKMVADWARFSQSLEFDAARIGVGVSQLHALEGSAQLAGSSAEAAAGGMKTLQDVMTDTVGGRNMEALVYFRQLGVAFDDGSGHALRATAVMPKLADAISRIKDPSLQARVATQFFSGAAESLLPWLRRGSAGMAQYAALAKHYGVETDESTDKANTFRFAQTRLTLAFKGLGNSISSEVSPPLTKMMTFLAELIARNRGLIADKFGSWAERLGKWVEAIDWEKVGSATERMANNIASITDSLSKGNLSEAWRKLMKLFGVGDEMTADGKIPMPRPDGVESTSPPLTPSQHTDRGRLMMGMFEGQGWAHEDAAAILSGLDRESGLRSGAIGDNGQAVGIAQWHPDRQAQFNAWSKAGGTSTGVDIQHASIEDQTRFIDWDLTKGKYKDVGDRMRAAKTLDDKVRIFDRDYESPADTEGAIRNDVPRAKQWAGLPPTEVSPPSLLGDMFRKRLERMSAGGEPASSAGGAAGSDGAAGPDDAAGTSSATQRPPWRFPWPHLQPAANQPSWIDRLDDGPLKRALQGSPEPSQAAPAPSRDPAPASSTHEVVVKIQTPPGTQATTTTTGTGPASVRVERAMQ